MVASYSSDTEDRPSSGIYRKNLERMAAREGTDTAHIDSTLTYGENKSALGLQPEGEEMRGMGVYEELDKQQAENARLKEQVMAKQAKKLATAEEKAEHELRESPIEQVHYGKARESGMRALMPPRKSAQQQAQEIFARGAAYAQRGADYAMKARSYAKQNRGDGLNRFGGDSTMSKMLMSDGNSPSMRSSRETSPFLRESRPGSPRESSGLEALLLGGQPSRVNKPRQFTIITKGGRVYTSVPMDQPQQPTSSGSMLGDMLFGQGSQQNSMFSQKEPRRRREEPGLLAGLLQGNGQSGIGNLIMGGGNQRQPRARAQPKERKGTFEKLLAGNGKKSKWKLW